MDKLKASSNCLFQSSTFNGHLEIRADTIDLTPLGIKFVNSIAVPPARIKVYWNFIHCPITSTQPVSVTGKQNLIKHSVSYQIAINESFLRCLSTMPVTFEVYVISYKQEMYLGRGEVTFKNLLRRPNEINHFIIEISNLNNDYMEETANMIKIYAQLFITCELKCEDKSLCLLMKKRYNQLDMQTFMYNLIEDLSPTESKEEFFDGESEPESERVNEEGDGYTVN